MNIISHNCVGARIYQMKGIKYENPFMWCVIPPEDFIYLYNNYNNINYENIVLKKENDDYKIIVDNKVNLYYVHYRYDENCEEPIISNNTDVFYSKIEDYIVKKYFSRLKRMKKEPLFIVTDRIFVSYPQFSFNDEDLLKFLNKDNCIIVTCNKEIVGKNVIYCDSKNMNTVELASLVINSKIYEDIFNRRSQKKWYERWKKR